MNHDKWEFKKVPRKFAIKWLREIADNLESNKTRRVYFELQSNFRDSDPVEVLAGWDVDFCMLKQVGILKES